MCHKVGTTKLLQDQRDLAALDSAGQDQSGGSLLFPECRRTGKEVITFKKFKAFMSFF